MKFLIPLLGLGLVAVSSTSLADEVAPTGLTVVVCDAKNQVLDSVVVPDDKKSRSVKFKLPEGSDQIRVFAVGKRQDKAMPSGFYITGRPDDKKWMGLGYVEAHIIEGVLMGIDGNGYGKIKIDDKLSKQIAADIKAAKAAKITTVSISGEQDGGGKGE